MIRSLQVKAAHGLLLLFQPVGWKNELHALPGAPELCAISLPLSSQGSV